MTGGWGEGLVPAGRPPGGGPGYGTADVYRSGTSRRGRRAAPSPVPPA